MKKILIVDDEISIQKLMEAFLSENTDYKLTFAATAEEAIPLAQEISPDLLIVDMVLPNMSGLALYFELRAIESLSELPVIFMSGKILDEDHIAEQVKKDNVEFVVKPLDIKHLLDIIKRLID